MSIYQKRVCPTCGEVFTQSYTEYMTHTITCSHLRKAGVTVLVNQTTCVDPTAPMEKANGMQGEPASQLAFKHSRYETKPLQSVKLDTNRLSSEVNKK